MVVGVDVAAPLLVVPVLGVEGLVSELLLAELLVGPVLAPPCGWLGCASANVPDTASAKAAVKMVLVINFYSLGLVNLTNRMELEAFQGQR